ncbi:MAG: acetyl-coenzyme A synthetase N-terminal domain-containing protein [Saprospiraceae bacterium]
MGRTSHDFFLRKPWKKVLDWNFRDPDVKWFTGGKLNITENCLDRHLATRGDKVALIWEPNDPEAKTQNLLIDNCMRKYARFPMH